MLDANYDFLIAVRREYSSALLLVTANWNRTSSSSITLDLASTDALCMTVSYLILLSSKYADAMTSGLSCLRKSSLIK